MPKPIQDLIARSIRTPSHSLSVKSKTNVDEKSAKEDHSRGFNASELGEKEASGIVKLNQLLE